MQQQLICRDAFLRKDRKWEPLVQDAWGRKRQHVQEVYLATRFLFYEAVKTAHSMVAMRPPGTFDIVRRGDSASSSRERSWRGLLSSDGLHPLVVTLRHHPQGVASDSSVTPWPLHQCRRRPAFAAAIGQREQSPESTTAPPGHDRDPRSTAGRKRDLSTWLAYH